MNANSTDPVVIDPQLRARSRRTLLLLLLVTIAPVIAAYAAFYWWQPSGRVNHGALIDPPIATTWPDEASALRQQWVMAYASAAVCDTQCEQALYYMRQVRVAQAKEMDRVSRAWIVLGVDGAVPQVAADHQDLTVLRAEAVAPALREAGHIQLVDPAGNVMMRFPASPDPKLMIKDLQRLLKYSRIG